MGARTPKPKTLKAYLQAALRPRPKPEQTNMAYALQGSLKSGRTIEHRQAAAFLARFPRQSDRADMIARALVLLEDIEELAQQRPELLSLTLEQICLREDEQG